MGWNDLRVSLVPVGRKLISEVDLTAKTFSGNPVAILDALPISEGMGLQIEPGSLESTLSGEGFVVTQRGVDFVRMTRENIESFLCIEEGALSEIILTFSVNRQSQTQVDYWQHLIDLLTGTMGMSLVDRGTQEPVVEGGLRRILSNSPVWNQFARRGNWPSLLQASLAESAHLVALYGLFAEVDKKLAADMLPIVAEACQLSEAA